MPDDLFPATWTGRRAIVSFPGQVDISNVDQLRDRLLSVINRGAIVLIADMTSTVSCDHAAVDAIARACQRAAASGTQLRLVVTAPLVRRVLSIEGLDRLVAIYPLLDAAIDLALASLAHAYELGAWSRDNRASTQRRCVVKRWTTSSSTCGAIWCSSRPPSRS